MSVPRWRLGSVLLALALAVMTFAVADKMRRQVSLRRQIEVYADQERKILSEASRYRVGRWACGNLQRRRAAMLAVAADRARRRAECERQLGWVW